MCIYDPRLVSYFKSSPLGQPPENFLKDNFEDQGSIQQTTDMAAEMSALRNDANARRQRLQQSLLTGLATAPIGAYSNCARLRDDMLAELSEDEVEYVQIHACGHIGKVPPT